MLLNLTICFYCSSMYSLSPMFSTFSSSSMTSRLFFGVHIKKSFMNFYFDQTNTKSKIFKYSSFLHFLRAPILVRNNELRFINKNFITNRIFSDNDVLLVIGCAFMQCSNKFPSRGGAIEYVNDMINGNVTIYSSVFSECRSELSDGGAIFVCGRYGTSGVNPTHKMINYFSSKYCCFSRCLTIADSNQCGYGQAMFVFAEIIEIMYNTAVKCPPYSKSIGAQFDFTSEFINSSYINSTESSARYCVAIEYRVAKYANLRFNSLVDLKGGFINSFSYLDEISITFCNYVNNTIEQGNRVGGFFYIKHSHRNICILNSCFARIYFELENYGFIYDADSVTSLAVQLKDCLIEQSLINRLNKVVTENVVIYRSDQTKFTNMIDFLDLSSCKGRITPPPIIFSPTFNQSSFFSNSILFSESSNFTKSQIFSPSVYFQSTSIFTKSNIFSSTAYFSRSYIFSESTCFSNTDIFTKSSKFSSTTFFSISNIFSDSQMFSASIYISLTEKFTESLALSNSHQFYNSESFTNTFCFTSFSNQVSFSRSIYETPTFLKSATFLKSLSITLTNVRTVIFSFSNVISNIQILSYISDQNTYSFVSSFSEVHKKFPYIIFSLSPSLIPTYLIFDFVHSSKISQGKLIGLVCGSVAAFFLILSIIILIIQKQNFAPEFYDSDILESSSSEYENVETHEGVTVTINLTNNDDMWI